MRTKASKIVFALSFLPIAFCFVVSVIGAFKGVSVGLFTGAHNIYDFEAFITSLLWSVLGLCAVPVIPACVIIQIACLLRNNESIRRIKLKKYIPITAAIVVVVCAGIALYTFRGDISFEIERANTKKAAVDMYKNADEIIAYRDESQKPLFDIEGLTQNSILIDKDNMEVGFVFSSYMDEFWKQKLIPTSESSSDIRHIRDDYWVQAVIPLNKTGTRLITFSEDGFYTNKTIAMILETENGIYFADEVREKDTGFSQWNKLDESDYTLGRDVKYSDMNI